MEKRFDETLKATSNHYSEALGRLAEGEKKSIGKELYVCELEDLLGHLTKSDISDKITEYR